MKRPLTEMDTRDTITCIALEGAVSTVEWGSRRSSFCGTEADEDDTDFRRKTRMMVIMSIIGTTLRSSETCSWIFRL